MVGTKDNRYLDIDKTIASQNTRFEAIFDPFNDGRDIFFWNNTADNLADDLVAFAFFIGLDLSST